MPTVPFYTPRVNQAPIANTQATARATAADFGSETASAVGAAGQAITGAANLAEKARQEEAAKQAQLHEEINKKLAMEGTNEFLEESGRARIEFESKPPGDVTPEALQKYQDDIANAQTKHRNNLPLPAQGMFDHATGRDIVAKRLDAESFFTTSSTKAAEQARKGLLVTSVGEAKSQAGQYAGVEALQRAFSAVDQEKGITPDEVAIKKTSVMSDVAAESVDNLLKQENPDQAAKIYESMKMLAKANGTEIDAKTQATIEGELKRATFAQTNENAVRDGYTKALETFPGDRPEDIESRRALIDRQTEQERADGTITTQAALYRAGRSQAIAEDAKRVRYAQDGAETKDAQATIDGSGDLTASLNYAKNLPAYLRDPMTRYAHERWNSSEAKALKAREMTDPEDIAEGSSIIAEGIKSGLYKNPAQVRANADRLRLPKEQRDFLEEMMKTVDHNVKGVSRPAVEKAVQAFTTASAAFDPKKHPDKAFALYQAVTEHWDVEQEPTPENLNKVIGTLLMQGSVPGAGGPEKTTYLQAYQTGRAKDFLYSFKAEELAATKADMKAQGLDPDPMHLEERVKRNEYHGKFFGLTDTRPTYEKYHVAVRDEADADSLESAYVLAQHGLNPGQSVADVRTARQTDVSARAQSFAAERVQKLDAAANLQSVISNARYGKSGIIGLQAMSLDLEKSLENNTVPKWLEDYTQAIGQGSIKTLRDVSETPDEWRVRARSAAMKALHEVGY